MRAIMLPFCEISAEDYKIAADRAGISAAICGGFTSLGQALAAGGKPDVIIMDFSWLQMLPYSAYAGTPMAQLASVPHVIVHSTPQADLSYYHRGEPLNVIGVLLSEDTHAPLFDRTKKNRLMMTLEYFKKLAASQPEDTVITARLFQPLMDRIKITPAATRARISYAAA
jgi:hypothetical protein